MADVEMTAHLWLRMIEDIKADYGVTQVCFQLMRQLGKTPKKNVQEFLELAGKL